MGLIIQNLIRIYSQRDDEEVRRSPMMDILRLWIQESDAKARTVLQRTCKILQLEYLQDQGVNDASGDRKKNPGRATGPEIASLNVDLPDPPRSVTRSMAKKADGKPRRGRQREGALSGT
jgi:hypothetical protein